MTGTLSGTKSGTCTFRLGFMAHTAVMVRVRGPSALVAMTPSTCTTTMSGGRSATSFSGIVIAVDDEESDKTGVRKKRKTMTAFVAVPGALLRPFVVVPGDGFAHVQGHNDGDEHDFFLASLRSVSNIDDDDNNSNNSNNNSNNSNNSE